MPRIRRRLRDRPYRVLAAAVDGAVFFLPRTGRYVAVAGQRESTVTTAARHLAAGGLITLARPVEVTDRDRVRVTATPMGLLTFERETDEQQPQAHAAPTTPNL